MPFKTYDIQISVSPLAKRPRLDLEKFIPFFLIAISNKMTANASRAQLKMFDVGVTEWRILSMLAVEPDIAPGRITGVVGIDKSSVSRALKNLEMRNYVRIANDPTHKRRQLLALTPDGEAIHDRIIIGVLEREEVLLTGFAPQERAQLIDYMKRLLSNMELVVDYTQKQLREVGLDEAAGLEEAQD